MSVDKIKLRPINRSSFLDHALIINLINENIKNTGSEQKIFPIDIISNITRGNHYVYFIYDDIMPIGFICLNSYAELNYSIVISAVATTSDICDSVEGLSKVMEILKNIFTTNKAKYLIIGDVMRNILIDDDNYKKLKGTYYLDLKNYKSLDTSDSNKYDYTTITEVEASRLLLKNIDTDLINAHAEITEKYIEDYSKCVKNRFGDDSTVEFLDIKKSYYSAGLIKHPQGHYKIVYPIIDDKKKIIGIITHSLDSEYKHNNKNCMATPLFLFKENIAREIKISIIRKFLSQLVITYPYIDELYFNDAEIVYDEMVDIYKELGFELGTTLYIKEL